MLFADFAPRRAIVFIFFIREGELFFVACFAVDFFAAFFDVVLFAVVFFAGIFFVDFFAIFLAMKAPVRVRFKQDDYDAARSKGEEISVLTCA
jgi:hypothetical protein